MSARDTERPPAREQRAGAESRFADAASVARARFRLTLVSLPAPVPHTVRLRRLLKVARRAFGFRVVGVEQIDEEVAR